MESWIRSHIGVIVRKESERREWYYFEDESDRLYDDIGYGSGSCGGKTHVTDPSAPSGRLERVKSPVLDLIENIQGVDDLIYELEVQPDVLLIGLYY